LVPMTLVYVAARLCLRSITAEEQVRLEVEHKKIKSEMKPVPPDISVALIVLVLLLMLELLLLPSTLIYWLLGLPFTAAVLRLDWNTGKLAICVIAYIGAALCWRWCLPLLRYELYSLIATLFDFPAGSHRRSALSRIHTGIHF